MKGRVHTEPGWRRIAAMDAYGRSVWIRFAAAPKAVLEICAGRAGKDLYVRLDEGVLLERGQVMDLIHVLDMGRIVEEAMAREVVEVQKDLW